MKFFMKDKKFLKMKLYLNSVKFNFKIKMEYMKVKCIKIGLLVREF